MMNQSCINLVSIFFISPLCRAISQYLWPHLALENPSLVLMNYPRALNQFFFRQFDFGKQHTRC